MQLLWEGRSAHRSSRSAALRPTPPLGARFTRRERVGAAAELRGGKAGLYICVTVSACFTYLLTYFYKGLYSH